MTLKEVKEAVDKIIGIYVRVNGMPKSRIPDIDLDNPVYAQGFLDGMQSISDALSEDGDPTFFLPQR